MNKIKIKWKTELRKVNELVEHSSNPRKLSKKSHDELLKSFNKFDYVELIAINTDGTILAGHQRVNIMKELNWLDAEIEVRVPSRTLTEAECREYLIRSNQNTGDWDWDILANEFDTPELLSFGFEEKQLLDGLDIPKFEPKSEEEVPDLTEKNKKECPNCGHTF